MEPLNQLLEARLDIRLGGVVLQIELAQAFSLRSLQRPLGRGGCRLFGALGEQVERVDGCEAVGESTRARCCAARAASPRD